MKKIKKPYELFDDFRKTTFKNCGDDGDYAITVDSNEKIIYVSFEESDGKRDWYNNFAFFPIPIKPYKNMKKKWYAHRGFVRVYHSIRDSIFNDLNDLMFELKDSEEYVIVILGWSHGGALAQLFYEDCVYREVERELILMTWGSPKPFYSKWKVKELLNEENQFCYENGSDFIVNLPPFGKGLVNHHVGEKFNIFKIFKVAHYHTDYGNKDIYE